MVNQMNEITIVENASTLTIHDETSEYARAKLLTLRTIGATSQRVYADTFAKWEAFAGSAAPLLEPGNVWDFLNSLDASKPTLQRSLAALRRLAQSLAIVNPDYQRTYEALKLLNLRGIVGNGKKRSKQVVSKERVYLALNQDASVLGVRDRALFAVAFYVGLRRQEIADLKWSDVDLEAGLVAVNAGKGRKETSEADIVPITSETAVEALQAWKELSAGRTYVFCRVLKPRKGEAGRLGQDKPISGEAIRLICKEQGFAPHDARRTLITSLDESGTPISVTQKIARHANVSTTLRYTTARQAKDLKDLVKLGY